jgi:hypothetical protein
MRAPPSVAPPSLQLQGVASDLVHGTPEPTTPTTSGSAPESPRFDASPSLSPSPIVQSPPTSSPAPTPPAYTVPVTRRQRGIVQKKVRTDGTIALICLFSLIPLLRGLRILSFYGSILRICRD